MIRHGTAPFLECSTRGERRLSAFNARPSMLNGRSIEEAYQCSKVLPDGSRPMHWREGKGKRATNANELALLYALWWRDAQRHPHLLADLADWTDQSITQVRSNRPKNFYSSPQEQHP